MKSLKFLNLPKHCFEDREWVNFDQVSITDIQKAIFTNSKGVKSKVTIYSERVASANQQGKACREVLFVDENNAKFCVLESNLRLS